MAQSVKHLRHKHEDLSSYPQDPCKSWVGWFACGTSAVGIKTEEPPCSLAREPR